MDQDELAVAAVLRLQLQHRLRRRAAAGEEVEDYVILVRNLSNDGTNKARGFWEIDNLLAEKLPNLLRAFGCKNVCDDDGERLVLGFQLFAKLFFRRRPSTFFGKRIRPSATSLLIVAELLWNDRREYLPSLGLPTDSQTEDFTQRGQKVGGLDVEAVNAVHVLLRGI